jgi:two-component system heavy metal sensor histidine kinase CusS
MWLALILLTPMLILTGHWVAMRGLAPLMRIVGAAKEVTPNRLSARIATTTPWPNELGELVKVFNDMLTRLEEGFTRLSRFSSDLAHELRTPLSNMCGELEVCLMSERSEQDYRTVLESNLEECRRLSVLVENLLFVARAEHAGLGLRREVFDAGEACAWVMDQLAPSAKANRVRLLLDGHAQIKVDPILFRQALVNLLANAIRYSHPGSQVLVGLRNDKNGSTTVLVSDHGIGIDAEHLPRLFDRFYQVNSSRTRNAGQGTGLGLSIVKAIVDMHGGFVSLDSEPGVGTTVSMHFPLPNSQDTATHKAPKVTKHP